MLSFESDYTEGAQGEILKRLLETNRESLSGYGMDRYSESAREKIRSACRCPQAEVYFLVGGTQTNAAVIDAFLDSYEGVVAAVSGHVNTHEAGAIEHTGRFIQGKNWRNWLRSAVVTVFLCTWMEPDWGMVWPARGRM